MALIIAIERVKQYDDGTRDYWCQVFVNNKRIAQGGVAGHDPKTGWKGLVKDLLDQLKYIKETK